MKRRDLTSIPNQSIQITNVVVNGDRQKTKGVYVLPYDSNNISVSFKGFSYHTSGTHEYRYRMTDVDDWSRIKETDVRFTTLPPGTYHFDVQARNMLDQHSEIKSVEFTILSPFYETWWFRTLAGLVVLGLGWLLFKLRINQVKKKGRLLEELHSSQHQALAARMNPHFIFNALNSIQQFTLNNDKERAAAYMRDYAHLMRLVLENSSSNLVNLESELKAMSIYLDLEQLRSQDRITYQIQFVQNFDTANFVLPALLLQPYLENAVWHGLMPKEPPGGEVVMVLKTEEDNLVIVIEDDGMGRAKALEQHTGNHPGFDSRGTDIAARRIELLERLYDIHITVQTEDRIDGEGKIAGTSVTLIIPQPQ